MTQKDHPRRLFFLPALLILLATVVACTPDSRSKEMGAAAETETLRQARTAIDLDPEAADRELADRLYLRLVRSRSLAGADLTVHVDDSDVVLEGRVADDAARERATRVAARTFGVEAVDNRLTVDAEVAIEARPSDNALARAVTQRLEQGPLIPDEVGNAWFAGWELRGDGWEIEVEVDDGTVLLSGTVPERDQVVDVVGVAHGVPGVRAVLSDLHWQTGLRAPGTPYPSGYYPYGYPTGHPRDVYPYDWDWYDPLNEDPGEEAMGPDPA